ncbi:MAG: hypothetical protein ACXQS8_00245 [Candidatus Helarchaeales archaeon]
MPTKLVKKSELYWLAKVGHGKHVAFYAIGKNLTELNEKIEKLAKDHFENLLELKGTWIKIVREFDLAELELNQNFLINVAAGLGDEIRTEIPPKIQIPVEFSLLPIMDFEKMDEKIWEFIEKRTILSKKEILYLVTGRTSNNIVAKLREFKSGLAWMFKIDPRGPARFFDVETGEKIRLDLDLQEVEK